MDSPPPTAENRNGTLCESTGSSQSHRQVRGNKAWRATIDHHVWKVRAKMYPIG